MIYILQLIYIREGEEHTFDEFERMAIPIISKYNGTMLFRIRPGENNVIERNMEAPYEIHLVQFISVQDFEDFKMDKERSTFLHLKEKSVKSTLLIKGEKV